MTRFQRQILLPEIGESGQDHLLRSKVLIVGAGGLGHPAFQYLVGMGVGQIGVMDGDTVHESNLHRQVLFKEGDIGANKADCLEKLASQRRDPVQVISYPFFLSKNSALEIFPQYDVIIDGSDNFETKMRINDACCFLRKPMVFGSISRFEGQVSVFWRGEGPCYRCLVPEFPKAKIQNCAEAGVVGAVTGVIGSLQALEALKVLLVMKDKKSVLRPLIGILQHYDFAHNESRKLKIPLRANCICQAEDFDLDRLNDIGTESSGCDLELNDVLVDVREQEEWAGFHVPTMVHWPLSRIEAGLFPDHLKDQKLTTVCRSGGRAEAAARLLAHHGFDVNYTHRSIYGFENRR